MVDRPAHAAVAAAPAPEVGIAETYALEPLERVLRDLRSRPSGLSDREAARRLEAVGPNALVRRPGPAWYRQLGEQLVHPLALLLWLAAALASVSGSGPLAIAIVVVILLNAFLAFAQERQAENAVEALSAYLPPHALVVRDGVRKQVDARELVPGDVVVVAEGDRVSADGRILEGSVEMDISALTGESLPVLRTADPGDRRHGLLQAPDVLFSGTACTQGEATAVVFATGMRSELGRIAALSQRVEREQSPLEIQVRRVARLIAVVAVGLGLAFIPIGTLLAGLPLSDTVTFSIGLLVANVPEGLLPTITLALAVGVRAMAKQGALVKRISAVETLGSTSVICTDKTGTLTLNQMRVRRIHTSEGTALLDDVVGHPTAGTRRLAVAGARCTNESWSGPDDGPEVGDATELALLRMAADLGLALPPEGDRVKRFYFDPALRRMTTVIHTDAGLLASTKGAPEEVVPRCSRFAATPDIDLSPGLRSRVMDVVDHWAADGLRVLAVAERLVGNADLADRDLVERELTLLGLVAMEDPPRPEAREAVTRCHEAGLRLIVVTGDHGLTARGVAQQVGIGGPDAPVITGHDLDQMSEDELDRLLEGRREIIFARSSPEAKLRIADALRAQGNVIAMTGDGINDAPALRRADIGVAMGRSGTEVAREAATMVLTDDNFATIVAAVETGRQIYDNVRKFIVYIFAHATPEVVPFLVYALSGGRVPLPLLVMQILAIDLGTETLPALALGREPPEPGIMRRPPRSRGETIIDRVMLLRAWALLGGVSAVLVTTLYLVSLVSGGWHPGDDVSTGPLNLVWRQATTMTFLAIVACQLGTAMAARTQRASLREVGVTTNPLLLWGMAFEVVFAAGVVTIPWAQNLFGTAVPPWWQLVLLLPCPLLVWGADESWRWVRRRRDTGVRTLVTSGHDAAEPSSLHAGRGSSHGDSSRQHDDRPSAAEHGVRGQ